MRPDTLRTRAFQNASCALLAAAFVVLVLRRGAAGGGAAPNNVTLAEPSLAHYRAELVRQRDHLTGVRLWGRFAIGVPAGLATTAGIARAEPALVRYVWLKLAAFAVAMPLRYVVGRRRARAFQRRIDALDALAGDAPRGGGPTRG